MTADFESQSNQLLEHLFDLSEENLSDRAEIDLEGAVLTIALDEGGTYVINRHEVTKQIWLSSPQSGAWHFALDADGVWQDTRGRGNLAVLLAQELGLAL